MSQPTQLLVLDTFFNGSTRYTHRPTLTKLHSTDECANLRLTETRGLRLPDEPQEGRNRSWAVDKFSATLCVVHYKDIHVSHWIQDSVLPNIRLTETRGLHLPGEPQEG
ncbi:hypothetical protein T265_05737 [Opisthorchis viverrini]|uniref:Uncharacterized protein n=1 Tax=Opisthorchis viverrini TaxID=6198 RepID=A0A074ZV19_OPIVI|nr:hypothetical protein T265_05737 [Opisthorchis viverrini]KER27205.1 hypothetical protein T265_05737 [Opisthorchis viverrini]